MANIDQGFNVDILSLSDSTLITAGEFDPSIVGYEAPEGSIFAFKNGATSALLLKNGTQDTDWLALSGTESLTMLTDVTITSPTTGQVLKYNGTQWVNGTAGTPSASHNDLIDRNLADQHAMSAITGLVDALSSKLSLSGGTMTGNLNFPKEIDGPGMRIEGQFAWSDLRGELTPQQFGSYSAFREDFIGPVTGWCHPAGAEGTALFHVPHDYAPGTDIFIHFHWGHNGSDIAGNFIINIEATYAKRGPQVVAAQFITPISTNLAINNLNIGMVPKWEHRVDEIQFSNNGGDTSHIDTAQIEVDGVIQFQYTVIEIPSINNSATANYPYIFAVDIHMQSTEIGTKSKDPGYYV